MENPIKIITETARRWRTDRQSARQQATQKEGLQTVQVMEFEGQLYLSYNGIPLVDIRFVEDIHAVLKDARTTREKYIAKFINQKQ
jgi:hypothetical protein